MSLSQVSQVEEAAHRIARRLPDMRVEETILCRVAVILGRDLTSRLDQLLAPAGLAELEFRLLLNLFARGGTAFPGELCPALAQSPANLTRISDLMEERGLITRTPDPEDRRKLAISITPAGEALAKQLAPQLTRYMTRLYSDFSDNDRARFMEYLKRLVGALDALAVEDAGEPGPAA
jgi:MarR family transcriptional regulator, negative regulator of the multidrug operon emrRAB